MWMHVAKGQMFLLDAVRTFFLIISWNQLDFYHLWSFGRSQLQVSFLAFISVSKPCYLEALEAVQRNILEIMMFWFLFFVLQIIWPPNFQIFPKDRCFELNVFLTCRPQLPQPTVYVDSLLCGAMEQGTKVPGLWFQLSSEGFLMANQEVKILRLLRETNSVGLTLPGLQRFIATKPRPQGSMFVTFWWRGLLKNKSWVAIVEYLY